MSIEIRCPKYNPLKGNVQNVPCIIFLKCLCLMVVAVVAVAIVEVEIDIVVVDDDNDVYHDFIVVFFVVVAPS